jgi:hypothetical protein
VRTRRGVISEHSFLLAGGNKNGFNRGENRLVKMIFAVLPAKTGKNSF